jgi:D-beta-D-heptose 7-phosphate kinase/D-beta-D-heptose 1-phosphate adenosyltransferase
MNIYPSDFECFSKATVLVVGDVMLDCYWHGSTSRISPEAPVPVVHVNREVERPGGAANVALGIAALGAKVHLLGIVGNDKAGETLKHLVEKAHVHQHLCLANNSATITKLRVLSHNQQMIRLDNEPETHLFSEQGIQAELQMVFEKLLASGNIGAVVLSDYGKGTLALPFRFIEKAKAYGIPVLVDPKSNDFSMYRGATLITPNLKEFEGVVGKSQSEAEMIQKAQALIRQHDMGTLVITRSEQGMSVISADGEVTQLPALAREVHDVTGAGDTVAAVLGIGLAVGMPMLKAATLGNQAAGLVVGKLGTATVTLEELAFALEAEQSLVLGVLTEDALVENLKLSKAPGERIVFTNGCFDILHAGHVMYLEQAKRLGDRLIVGVNTDASVSALKGPKRPINTLENRMAVLAALKSVDWVVPFGESTPERLIKRLSPQVLVKGGDYVSPESLVGAAHVMSYGGTVHILGLQEGCSTTRTIESILA